MNVVKTESVSSRFDTIKWLAFWLLVVIGIVGNIYFSDQPGSLRVIVGLVLGILAIAAASFTDKGKLAWLFVRDARTELRKVVWPTRQETTQATLVVVAVVILAALILWGFDSVLLFVIGLITG